MVFTPAMYLDFCKVAGLPIKGKQGTMSADATFKTLHEYLDDQWNAGQVTKALHKTIGKREGKAPTRKWAIRAMLDWYMQKSLDAAAMSTAGA